jgi:hypothetical protein
MSVYLTVEPANMCLEKTFYRVVHPRIDAVDIAANVWRYGPNATPDMAMTDATPSFEFADPLT